MNATAASPKTASLPLAELVRTAQQGDQIAFHQLYQLHRGMVKSIVLAILKNEANTEDVLQESFLQTWLKIGDLHCPERFSGWILRIARNKALDFFKRKGPGCEVGDIECFPTPDNLPTPLTVLVRAEERKRLLQAVAKLPERERQAVTMIYFEGLTLREISERTGTPIGTLKRRVHTARQHLRAMLVDRD